MAKVNICDVEVLNNPATFFDKFQFRITFECHEPLEEDLEWKVVYVGSAYNSSLDQTLDSILVGPVPIGRHQFVLEVDPPDPKRIPAEDLVGVTVVLVQALYRDHEFIRVGYYVNNEYKSEELRNEPPSEPLLHELERNIIASDPRVTRFPIDWGDGLLDGCAEPEQKEETSNTEVLNCGAVPSGSGDDLKSIPQRTSSEHTEISNEGGEDATDEDATDEETDLDDENDDEDDEKDEAEEEDDLEDENSETTAAPKKKPTIEAVCQRPSSPLRQLQNETEAS